jgi:hypothetical protein
MKKIREDLNKLYQLSEFMLYDLEHQRDIPEIVKSQTEEEKEQIKALSNFFIEQYQNWYSESLILIKQILPDREKEFIELYKGNGKRKFISNETYNIQDWLRGAKVLPNEFNGKKGFDDHAIVLMNFVMQYRILKSVGKVLDSFLISLKSILQADLFDNELDKAKELVKNGFLRPAGVICGVILEKHLSTILSKNGVKTKKHPTLAELNESCRTNNIFQKEVWRHIQLLADIRNLCCHHSEQEPTKDQLFELINGTNKITKTVC